MSKPTIAVICLLALVVVSSISTKLFAIEQPGVNPEQNLNESEERTTMGILLGNRTSETANFRLKSKDGKEIEVKLKPGEKVWIFAPNEQNKRVTCVYKMEPPDSAISVCGKRVTVTLMKNGFTPPSFNATDPIVLTPSQSRGFASKYIRMKKSKEYIYTLERLF